MGIELSRSRHEDAMRTLASSKNMLPVTFICCDASGEDAQKTMSHPQSPSTIVWYSNLLFDQNLKDRISHTISSHGTNVRAVASLKSFPNGIPGMTLQKYNFFIEMSWTANKEQPGYPPLAGHPCSIYYSSPSE